MGKSLKEKLEVGQHYRSEIHKTLLTVAEVDQENDIVKFQIADSNHYMSGALQDVKEAFRVAQIKQISEEDFKKYLETYSEDISEITKQEQLSKLNQLRSNYVEIPDIMVNEVKDNEKEIPMGMEGLTVPLVINFDFQGKIGEAIVVANKEAGEVKASIFVDPKRYEEIKRLYPAVYVDLNPKEAETDENQGVESIIYRGVSMVMDHKDLEDMPYLKQIKDFSISEKGLQL